MCELQNQHGCSQDEAERAVYPTRSFIDCFKLPRATVPSRNKCTGCIFIPLWTLTGWHYMAQSHSHDPAMMFLSSSWTHLVNLLKLLEIWWLNTHILSTHMSRYQVPCPWWNLLLFCFYLTAYGKPPHSMWGEKEEVTPWFSHRSYGWRWVCATSHLKARLSRRLSQGGLVIEENYEASF